MNKLLLLCALVFTLNSGHSSELEELYSVTSPEVTTLFTDCQFSSMEGYEASCTYILITGKLDLSFGNIVPANQIYLRFKCWEASSDCDTDTVVNNCLGDIKNIYPMTEYTSRAFQHGKPSIVTGSHYLSILFPEFKISADGNAYEPPDGLKGLFARAWLHMYASDCITLSDEELKVYYDWESNSEPDEAELLRDSIGSTLATPPTPMNPHYVPEPMCLMNADSLQCKLSDGTINFIPLIPSTKRPI